MCPMCVVINNNRCFLSRIQALQERESNDSDATTTTVTDSNDNDDVTTKTAVTDDDDATETATSDEKVKRRGGVPKRYTKKYKRKL